MGLKMGLALGDNWVQIGFGLGPNGINKNKIIMKTKTISYDKIQQLKITTTKINKKKMTTQQIN